jgi:hypothetical protein
VRRDEDTAIRRRRLSPREVRGYLSWGIPGSPRPGRRAEAQLRRLAADRFASVAGQVSTRSLAQHAPGDARHHAGRWPGMPQDDILAGLELLGRAASPGAPLRTRAVGG